MTEVHRHTGVDNLRINVNDLVGPAIITSNWATSARSIQPTIIQHGNYTLAANVKFVTFPQTYTETTELQILLTSKTNNHSFLDSIALSGFTVSGSGTDTGVWLSIGYK